MTLEDTRKEITVVVRGSADPGKDREEIEEIEDQDRRKEKEKMREKKIREIGQNLGILLCKENLLSNSGTKIIIKIDSVLFLI